VYEHGIPMVQPVQIKFIRAPASPEMTAATSGEYNGLGLIAYYQIGRRSTSIPNPVSIAFSQSSGLTLVDAQLLASILSSFLDIKYKTCLVTR